MAQDEVDEKVLKETFNRLFRALPGFLERYPDVVDTVKSVFFPPKSEGKFAFVEFVDEVLTTTAIAMSGFELHGYWIRAFETFFQDLRKAHAPGATAELHRAAQRRGGGHGSEAPKGEGHAAERRRLRQGLGLTW